MGDLLDELASVGLVSQQRAAELERQALARERIAEQRGGLVIPPPTTDGPPRSPGSGSRQDDLEERLNDVVGAHRARLGRGQRRWYYCRRDGSVGWFDLEPGAAADLEAGRLAIVEVADAAVVITSDGARLAGQLAPDRLRCFNG